MYFSTSDGTFYALRARDGALKWQASLGARASGPPAVAGDLVYVGAGTTLFGLSARTGAIMRAYHPYADQELHGDPSTWLVTYSAPIVSDGIIFFATSAQSCAVHCHLFPLDTTLFALDAETGAQRWARTESPGLPLALTLGP